MLNPIILLEADNSHVQPSQAKEKFTFSVQTVLNCNAVDIRFGICIHTLRLSSLYRFNLLLCHNINDVGHGTNEAKNGETYGHTGEYIREGVA